MSAVNISEDFQSFGDTTLSASTVQLFGGSCNSETAIKVENVCKKYGKQLPVLKNFNMTVPKGSIYALLGSSGCGKTTILSCVVGRHGWDAGTISVLGSPPSKKPITFLDCKRIGYMPQELALQERLTIQELLLLYGRIFGMSTTDILARFMFLQGFLQLPKENRTVKTLSGGQQRRVSLAVALLHEPDLIILDEPTVGLDPLLRQSIWQYLQDLVINLQVTIVLTTHYVDEARRSNVVGLMRHGRLIAEESPQQLMKQYQSSSLDKIVLEICKKDNATKLLSKNAKFNKQPISRSNSLKFVKGKLGRAQSSENVETSVASLHYRHSMEVDDILPINQQDHFSTSFAKKSKAVSQRKNGSNNLLVFLRRIGGILMATVLSLMRHPGFIPLGVLMPPVTASLAQVVFGSDLHDLPFGYIVNNELSKNMSTLTNVTDKANCLESDFSYLFLNKINPGALTMIPFSTKSIAIEATKAGHIWGFVNIPDNYTNFMKERMLARHFSDMETINGTMIGIYLDMSNILGSILVIKNLFETYQAFLQELAISCGLPSKELEIPLKYNTPVYGDLDGSYTTQVVPGLIILCVSKLVTTMQSKCLFFGLQLAGCSVLFIQDRNAGCLDRMRVSGMSNFDLIVTIFITNISIQLAKLFICTAVLIFGFSYVIRGPILLYILLMVCNSSSGMALGYLLAHMCTTEVQALVAVFFCASFLIPFSGVIWPIEGLQFYWRTLAYCLPTTLVSQSFRSVVFRGVSYDHILVWPGLVVPIVWVCASLLVTLVIFRRT